jgi:hypothetical protein
MLLRFFRLLCIVCSAVTTLLLLADSYGNPVKSYNLLGIAASNLVVPSLLLVLVYRLFTKLALWSARYNYWLMWLAGVGVGAAAILTIVDFWTYPNAVYGLTRIYHSHLLLMMVYLFHLGLINLNNSWWQRHQQRLIILYPFALFIIALLTWCLPFDVFEELVKEDRLVEYAQFTVLVLGAVAVATWARWYHQQGHRWLMAGCIMLGVALTFVAGDEISWGQRLFGFESTQLVKQINNQGETTIHNLHVFEWLVLYAYIAIAALGLVFGGRVLLGYFLFPLVFYLLQATIRGGIFHYWAELAELYLYTGMVLSLSWFGQMQVMSLLATNSPVRTK